MVARVGITTAKRVSAAQLKVVAELKGQFKLPFLARQKRSIKHLIEHYALDYLFVVESEQLYLSDGQTRFFWHPNTALLKLKERVGGPLIEALAVRPGDRVLDCTMGLAADALVIASQLTAGGSVTALESNRYICYLTARGLATTDYQLVRQLAERLAIVNCDYRDYLAAQADKAFDTVYFDPMFKSAKRTACGIAMLRKLANQAAITADTIAAARRVASRCVVLKERFGSGVLEALKPDYIVGERRSGRVVYGVFKR